MNTEAQFNAIRKEAGSNSLVRQLFAGKPKTQRPSVIAASTSVRNKDIPRPLPVTPKIPEPKTEQDFAPQTPSSPAPVPLVPPITTGTPAIKSHSVQHPDGTTVTQQFHKPEAIQNNTQNPSMPEPKIIDGMHHVPFKAADGTMKFINANGDIH